MHIEETRSNNAYASVPAGVLAMLLSLGATASDGQTRTALEEVVVTAQKREQLLQDTPIAISVLSGEQLSQLGVSSLDGLSSGVVPSLRISPSGNTPSSLAIAIRGDGAFDVAQPTRQGSVAIYDNGIYLGHAQGLSMELADLQRIEVLQGPQGTLYGRNSTSGAINLISHKPTGEFGIKQLLSTGKYDEFRSITRINLPATADVSTKLDYMHSQRDGWVENSQGQSDFNEYKKQGGKLSVDWQASDTVNLYYTYDQSNIENTHVYYQLYDGALPPTTSPAISIEKDRQTSTRFALALEPTDVDLRGHSLTATWELTEHLTIKSLSSYRQLDENGFSNYGGTLGSLGLIIDEDIEQEQLSQEFQIIGSYDQLHWVAGLFYFKEASDFDLRFLISLDTNGNLIPPVGGGPITMVSEAESYAAFGQGTLELSDQFSLTVGARYTKDDSSAVRAGFEPPAIDSDHADGSVALAYNWTEDVSTYVRLATAYKAGGYNIRSLQFLPYDEEATLSSELGFKSQWLDRRVRINAALFNSTVKDKQFDFNDPGNILITETLNAEKDVDISGFEMNTTALIGEGLEVGFNYTYLDGDMPRQPYPSSDPLYAGAEQLFEMVQTPRHAGALTIDYTMQPLSFGTLTTHLDIASTGRYAHSTTPTSSQDGYTLINARLTLEQIDSAVMGKGNLKVSLWGRNITDEEYANIRFKLNAPDVTIQSFGTPRTVGIDVVYEL